MHVNCFVLHNAGRASTHCHNYRHRPPGFLRTVCSQIHIHENLCIVPKAAPRNSNTPNTRTCSTRRHAPASPPELTGWFLQVRAWRTWWGGVDLPGEPLLQRTTGWVAEHFESGWAKRTQQKHQIKSATSIKHYR